MDRLVKNAKSKNVLKENIQELWTAMIIPNQRRIGYIRIEEKESQPNNSEYISNNPIECSRRKTSPKKVNYPYENTEDI